MLAIDLGGKMGWFKANATGPAEFGTFSLDDTTDLGRWLVSSDSFFQKVLVGVTSIAVEKPNTSGSGKKGHSAYFAIRKNMALLGHLYYHAAFFGHGKINEVSVATGKLTLAGHGHADKSQMIAAARAEGYDVDDEHQADAYAIWKVHVFGAREPLKPRRRHGPVTVTRP